MRWVVNYITHKKELESFQCVFYENALAMCNDLLSIGYCSWVEDTELSSDFEEYFGKGYPQDSGSD